MCSRAVVAWIDLRREEGGQDLLEFGLLTSLIATFMIGALTAMGSQVNDVWVHLAGGF
jgi:Flp pilus assembly pilin Flp